MSVVDLPALVGRFGVWAAALAAAVLVAESALLVGVVLPGISLTVGLGALAATGTVPRPVALGVTVAAAALGPSIGYWNGRRSGVRLPAPAHRLVTMAASRPMLAVATGQWFAVSRTLAPRLAGRSMSYRRFALLNVPVAAGWAAGTFALGHLVVEGSAVAARVLSVQQAVGTVLLVALAVVVAVVAVRVVRARRAGQADAGTET